MEQFQYHMRQYEEDRLQMNDDEEYGHGFKNLTHAYRNLTLLKTMLRNSSIT